MQFVLAIAALFAGSAAARKCRNITIPIDVTARNPVFNIPDWTSNVDVTNWVLHTAYPSETNYTDFILSGYATVSPSFEIAATYCHPDSGPSSSLQVLLHGLGWDRNYWNLAYNNYNYSYTAYAVDKYNFSTLAYDEPGVGDSSVADPLNVIQASTEYAVLEAITANLRNGTLPNINAKFDKVTHVGQSTGAIYSYGLTVRAPHLTDGVTMTGITQTAEFFGLYTYGVNLALARKSDPARFGNRTGNWILEQNPTGYHSGFFGADSFDPGILEYTYKRRGAVASSERITPGIFLFANSSYTGPIHMVVGEEDILACGGNCWIAPAGYNSVPETTKAFAPLSKFKVNIINQTGSALNAHYTHPESFTLINDFYIQNGLGPKKVKA